MPLLCDVFPNLSNIRAKPIVLDPGLYLSKKFDLTMTTERRELPTSFKLYTGRPDSEFNIQHIGS